MPYKHNAPFRYDVVGSFLRPDVLKQARADHAAGIIDDAQLKTVENEAIRDLVAKQKAAGLHVITDGEFRRSYWHLDFMWGLQGIERRTSRTGYMFHDEETTADTAVVTGKISGESHPFVEHFKFVKALEEEGQVARQTIPAPAQTYSEVILDRCDGQQESLRSVYPTDEELIADIAAAYRTVLADLYAAGCRNVQFDDCTWGIYCDRDFVAKTGMSPVDIQKVSELGVAINNAALEGKPADLVVNTHVCRGNYHSTYAFEGDYDPVAPYLFANEDVNAFYLEFDTPRAGGWQEGGSWPGHEQAARPRGRGAAGEAHLRGRPVRAAGGPLPLPTVRLCLLRVREQAHRGGAVGQGRPGPARGKARVGRGLGNKTHINSAISWCNPDVLGSPRRRPTGKTWREVRAQTRPRTQIHLRFGFGA